MDYQREAEENARRKVTCHEHGVRLVECFELHHPHLAGEAPSEPEEVTGMRLPCGDVVPLTFGRVRCGGCGGRFSVRRESGEILVARL